MTPDRPPTAPGAEPIVDCLARRTWAVVGASKDPTKFGNMVYFDLRAGGYRVLAVNPNATEVEGDQAWPTLSALPERPDVVDFVTPPEVTAKVVEEALGLGLTRLWFQPGSVSPETLARAREAGATVVTACAMTERHRRQVPLATPPGG